MRGIYRFYSNGELIAEHANVLTNEGKRLIMRVIAGISPSVGAAIGLGVSATPAAAPTDTRPVYEAERINVDLRVPDYVNSKIVFKGTIPQTTICEIYEAGLWSQPANLASGSFQSKVITDFSTDNWTNSTSDTLYARINGKTRKVTVGASATVQVRAGLDPYGNPLTSLDLSGYTSADNFLVAFYKPNNNMSTLKLVFENSVGGSFSKSATISSLPVGYNVVSYAKSGFTKTGTISWDGITNFGVDITATATGGDIWLDGIRVEDDDAVSADYVMVSRATFASPVSKTSVAPMDIEYALEFDIL